MNFLGRRLSNVGSRGFSGLSMTQVVSEPMAWNQAPAQVTVLPNGVRVATKETFSEVASVGVFINAGSRDETNSTAGAAHLVEQLSCRGTSTRSRAKLEQEVESMGATLKAKCGREQSSYCMSLFKGDERKGLDILSDIVRNVGSSNFAQEKADIVRRLDEREVPTREVIDDRLHACAFRDGPLGFSAVGPFENIGSLTEAHVKSYVDSNYTAENMVISSSGQISHAEMVKAANEAFGSVKGGIPRPVSDKPYFCGAELIYRNDEMGPTAYISIGWEGVPWKSPDAVAFMVMESIIGTYTKHGGLVPGVISGNRVANAVANKMNVGCADEYQAFNKFYRDTGMFGFYIACDEVAVEHAVGELMFGVNLLSFSVTEEEVARAKRELKAKLFSTPTSSLHSCEELGTQMLAYGRGIPPAEMILRIDAIDSEDIKRVAWKYLNDAEISVTALGPLHGISSYYELRRMTTMHRY